jgi:VanZ family protein
VPGVRASRWAPAAFWAAAILVATSFPRPDRFLPPVFPGADKIVHFTLYAILALLVHRAVASSVARSTLLGIALGLVLFAAADEWHQQYIPGRGVDAADWLADVAGIGAGLLIAESARRRRESPT